jgi:hypothetical protein
MSWAFICTRTRDAIVMSRLEVAVPTMMRSWSRISWAVLIGQVPVLEGLPHQVDFGSLVHAAPLAI